MATKLACPECAASLAIPDALVGKTIRCKKCGATFKAEMPLDSDEDSESLRREREPNNARRSRPIDDEVVRPRRRNDDEEEYEQVGANRPRKASSQTRPRGKKKRPSNSGTPLVLTLIVAVVLLVVVGGGMAYLFGAFDSTKEKSTPTANNNSDVKATRPGSVVKEEVIEEITIQQITVKNEDGGGSPGFAVTYRWKNGRVPPGIFFEVMSIPGGQTRERPFEHSGLAEGLIQYEQVSNRGRGDFDFWIGKRRSATLALVRISNVIHITVKK